MADQVNPGRAEEHEAQESGLFLSSEPIEGTDAPLRRAAGDDTDTADAVGDTDASDTDASDTDDGGAEKGDLADAGADTDSSDKNADAMDIIGDNLDGSATRDADATDAK